MPRIPQKILDSVVYLYDSEESARAGKNFGGTGFIVALPSEQGYGDFTFVVTNWHVACQKGFSVIRINTRDGGADIIPYGPEDWFFDPVSGYDIAVAFIPIRQDLHRFALIQTGSFLEKGGMESESLGPGEDVFMVGRFVDHDGGQVNLSPGLQFAETPTCG